MNETAMSRIYPFLFQLPGILMCLAGVTVAALRWKSAPRAALWCLLGFGFLLLNHLASTAMFIVIPMLAQQARGSTFTVTSVMPFASVALSLFGNAALVMLLVAVFVGRNHTSSRDPR